MINLIKNEYHKLPGKIVIIILLFAVAYLEAYTYSVNIKYNDSSEERYDIYDYEIAELKDELSRNSINDKSTTQEIDYYYGLKAKSFMYDYIINNIDGKNENWKFLYALDSIGDYKEVLLSEYYKQDDYQKVKDNFDNSFYNIIDNDYKYYLDYQLKKYQDETNENNKLLELLNKYRNDSNSLTEEEKMKVQLIEEDALKLQNETNNISIEYINYQLKYLKSDNTIDNNILSTLSDYADCKTALLTLNPNREAYSSDKEYQEKYLTILAGYKTSEYQILNDTFVNSDEPQELLATPGTIINIIVLFAIFVFIISHLVGEEFTKGTIKQLLIRPHTRSEILTAKIIFLILSIVFYSLLFFGFEYLLYGYYGGYENFSHNLVLFNYNTAKLVVISPMKYLLIKVISAFPYYFLVSLVALFLSLITKNSAFPILSCAVLGFAEIIAAQTVKIPKYFISNKTDFAALIFRGEVSYVGQTVYGSLSYLGLIIIVLLVIDYFIFNRMDIKNQ